MLKLRNDKKDQITIYEAILPKEMFELDDELKKVDQLLDDESFFEPFTKRFSTKTGRNTIPIESYLRLMYLKHRFNMGYETLVKEVSDSIKWRTFCHFTLDDPLPDPTSLIKATKRYGEDVVKEINDLLVKKASKRKIIRGRKLRIDTTVVEADIHHPTDAGLIADGVRVITRTVEKLKKSGHVAAQDFRDRTRSIKKRLFKVSNILRRKSKGKKEQIHKINAEMVSIAKEVLVSAKEVKYKISSESQPIAEKMDHYLDLLHQVICQTEGVLKGNTRIPNRVVSIFDPEARPIKKGKLDKPVEFGRKLCLIETEERIITEYELYNGNPADTGLLAPTVKEHTRKYGKVPWAVAADAGFGSADNRDMLTKMGVKRVSLPLRGRKNDPVVKQRWYKRLQRFRAGVEGTISVLKRQFGLDRSRYKGTAGSQVWTGLGIMSYNLRRIAQLM